MLLCPSEHSHRFAVGCSDSSRSHESSYIGSVIIITYKITHWAANKATDGAANKATDGAANEATHWSTHGTAHGQTNWTA